MFFLFISQIDIYSNWLHSTHCLTLVYQVSQLRCVMIWDKKDSKTKVIYCWLQWGYIQIPILDQPNFFMLLQRVKCPTDVPHLVQLHLEALLICLLLDVIEQNIYYVCCVLSFFWTGGEFQYVFCLPSVFLFIFHWNNWTGENFFFELGFFLRREVLAVRTFIFFPEIS